jgi:hypothetical protein
MRKILHYAPSVIMLTGDVSNAKMPRITDVIVWLTGKPLNPQLLLAAVTSSVLVHTGTLRSIYGLLCFAPLFYASAIAEGDLQYLVKLRDIGIARHQQPSPNERTHAAQHRSQLKNYPL